MGWSSADEMNTMLDDKNRQFVIDVLRQLEALKRKLKELLDKTQ